MLNLNVLFLKVVCSVKGVIIGSGEEIVRLILIFDGVLCMICDCSVIFFLGLLVIVVMVI